MIKYADYHKVCWQALQNNLFFKVLTIDNASPSDSFTLCEGETD